MFISLFIYLFKKCIHFGPHHTACGILVPQPAAEPGAMTVKAPSPNHWITREFPMVMNFLFVHLYLFLVALGLCCCMHAFSSCGEQDLFSHGAQASHCSGFSCCRTRALVVASVGSVAATCWL